MKLRDLIIWILFILTIIIIFWYILGSSPTLEQAILILILTLAITTIIKTSVIENKLENLERSFIRLASDFKEHTKHKQNVS